MIRVFPEKLIRLSGSGFLEKLRAVARPENAGILPAKEFLDLEY